MDAVTITTTATTTSERLAAEENSETGAVEAAPVEGKRLQCSKCKKKAMKDGKGLCWEHGERKRCEHGDCAKFAKRKGFCDDHGMMVLGLMRPKCKSPGCTKQPVKGGVCIAHGAKRVCMIVGCKEVSSREKSVHITTDALWDILDLIGIQVSPE